MTILLQDGRELSGTAVQIVQEMRRMAFPWRTRDLREYVAKVVETVSEVEGVKLEVSGESEDELAQSLLVALVAAGLAQRAMLS